MKDHFSSEKRLTAEKVPVAQIIIPLSKKNEHSSSKPGVTSSNIKK
jgi:hypothetical protein